MMALRRLRVPGILGVLLLMLAACTTSVVTSSAPTPTPTDSPEVSATDPNQPIQLASGHYQLVMFYAPT